jgi:membrane fusion protein (multidrug efflux system)
VQELQNLYTVAVVGADNMVSFRNVKVGPRVDSLWVIEEGLKPGDKVVAEGLQALTDGQAVRTKAMAAQVTSTPGASAATATAPAAAAAAGAPAVQAAGAEAK